MQNRPKSEIEKFVEQAKVKKAIEDKEALAEQERKEKEKNDAYRHREEVRSTITLVFVILSFLLSLISLIWQAPLHSAEWKHSTEQEILSTASTVATTEENRVS